MSKQSFIKILPTILICGLIVVSFAGCQKEEINKLKERISELERQSNTENEPAQSSTIAISQDNDGNYYWTINGEWLLANGEKVRANGQDGNEGYTPTISIAKDYDEEYYWKIDGSWVIADGKQVRAIGKDGVHGVEGPQGIQGPQGPKGDNGDSLFKEVTQDEDYVYFTLADETVIVVRKVEIDNEEYDNPIITQPTVIPTGFVDLGLPSGLLWAASNLRAGTPEEYGEFYAWGETETKPSYPMNNTTNNMNLQSLKNNGIVDKNGNLTASYDAATQELGSAGFRMPTAEEFKELIDNCEWVWVSGEIHGYKVYGTNGNIIFLPACGYASGSSHYDAETYGHYWTSTAKGYDDYSSYLYFSSESHGIYDNNRRGYGRSIRPVCDK